MATANLTATVSTQGASKSTRELKVVGQQAKKTENNVIQMGGAFTSVGKNASAAAAAISGPMSGISSRISAVTTLMTSGAATATLFGAAITGLGFALTEGVQELDRMNVELAKTEAILNATGSASGKTALQLQSQAQAIALATLASTQGIQQAQAKLLTFDKIQGKVFDDAISLTQDLATVFGGDASSQATQLGKALQDPVAGLTALNRVGVSFTEQQADQVKALVKSGDTMKAQAIIIEALKNQVGGAGESVAKDSLAGKIDTAGQLWSEFSAKLAGSTGAITITEKLLDGVVGRLGELNEALAPDTATDFVQQALDLAFAIGEQEQALEGLAKGSREYEIGLVKIARLEAQRATAIKDGVAASKIENEETLKRSAAYEASQIKIKNDALALEAETEKEARDKKILAELAFLEKREAYAKEQADKLNEINKKAYEEDAKNAAEAAKLKVAEDKQIEREAKRAQREQVGALSDTTDALGSLLGEQNALYKASAIINATITTYESANKAFNALAGIPVVGPALGGAAAGVAIAAGLANVRAISSAREQGGQLASGQGSSIAERGKLEIITPNSSSRVRTKQQMQQILGEGSSSGPAQINVVNINQSSQNLDIQTSQDEDGRIVQLITDTVPGLIDDPTSGTSKALSRNLRAERVR